TTKGAESWRVTALRRRYQRRRSWRAGMRFSRSIRRLHEEAGSACSSGPSASGVKTQAGGSSIGSLRTTGKDQLASRQRTRHKCLEAAARRRMAGYRYAYGIGGFGDLGESAALASSHTGGRRVAGSAHEIRGIARLGGPP